LSVSSFLPVSDLVGIDDDDVVAIVDMRGEGRLVLAAQAVGDDGGETADDEVSASISDPLLPCGLIGDTVIRRLLRPLKMWYYFTAFTT
jgi:hypothetical protein